MRTTVSFLLLLVLGCSICTVAVDIKSEATHARAVEDGFYFGLSEKESSEAAYSKQDEATSSAMKSKEAEALAAEDEFYFGLYQKERDLMSMPAKSKGKHGKSKGKHGKSGKSKGKHGKSKGKHGSPGKSKGKHGKSKGRHSHRHLRKVTPYNVT